MQRRSIDFALFAMDHAQPTHSASLRRRYSRAAISLAAFTSVGLTTAPAQAVSPPSTQLVRCSDEMCLKISGYREDAAAIVSINGRTVSVEGANRWRVTVPVDLVRQWSAPHARSIEVSLENSQTRHETTADVALPIGLLGGVNLETLVIDLR